MSPQHVGPEEAVRVHLETRSRKSLGIHWGTFILTMEPVDEPAKKLADAAHAASLQPDEFITVGHGETFVVNEWSGAADEPPSPAGASRQIPDDALE